MKTALTALAALFLASPAHAALQIAADIDGASFFCSEGMGCDTSPQPDLIITNNATLGGILFSSSSASSASGATDFLNVSNLLIRNTLSHAVDVTITVSNTDFTAPIHFLTDASSGVWQGAGGSSAIMKWFVDPLNAQGADNAFDTPGLTVDTASSTATGPVLAFSRNSPNLVDNLTSPFSMTEQVTIHLAAGESLVNRGQTIIGSAIPEPSTWVMLGLGFGGLAFAALGRKRSERALA